MNSKVLIGIFIIIIGLLAGWYAVGGFTKSDSSKSNGLENVLPKGNLNSLSENPVSTQNLNHNQNLESTNSTATSENLNIQTNKGGETENTVVVYSDNGFSPEVLRIKINENVIFINDSSGQMWVVSDPHPMHNILVNFNGGGNVQKGANYSYKFTEIGTFRYHNEANPKFVGTIVVEK